MAGRLAASEDAVLFASYDEVDKCEFIKMNAPKGAWEAWSSTDDGAGLLLHAGALRAQAREVLVSAALWNLLAPAAMPCPLAPSPTPLTPLAQEGPELCLAATEDPATEPAATKEPAAMKKPVAAVKEETTRASCPGQPDGNLDAVRW